MDMNELKNVVASELEKSKDVVLNFPWHDPQAYGMWLTQTYHIVTYSTRLLTLASACAPLEHKAFHDRLLEHAREEANHEKIAIVDLKKLGKTIDDFPALYQSLAMFQIQFFWIEHRHAVSIYGYTLALETLAEAYGEKVVEKIEGAFGKNSAKFLTVHSTEDVDHLKMTYEEIELLSPAERKLIAENLRLSAQLYRGMLTEIAQRVQVGKTKAA